MARLVSYVLRHKYCIARMAIMIAIHHQNDASDFLLKKRLSALWVRDCMDRDPNTESKAQRLAEPSTSTDSLSLFT